MKILKYKNLSVDTKIRIWASVVTIVLFTWLGIYELEYTGNKVPVVSALGSIFMISAFWTLRPRN